MCLRSQLITYRDLYDTGTGTYNTYNYGTGTSMLRNEKVIEKESFYHKAKIVPVNKTLIPSSVPDPDPTNPHVFGPTGSFYHQAKIVRKTLIPSVL
jgi:hypothetical protein